MIVRGNSGNIDASASSIRQWPGCVQLRLCAPRPHTARPITSPVDLYFCLILFFFLLRARLYSPTPRPVWLRARNGKKVEGIWKWTWAIWVLMNIANPKKNCFNVLAQWAIFHFCAPCSPPCRLRATSMVVIDVRTVPCYALSDTRSCGVPPSFPLLTGQYF
jgi:hypothetical protein